MKEPDREPSPENPAPPKEFPCAQCGATMTFDPDAGGVACAYCGHVAEIESSESCIEELDFTAHLESLADSTETDNVLHTPCSACGAEIALAPDIVADVCPFCDSPIIAAPRSLSRIRPRSLAPFAVTRKQAVKAFRKWVDRLWFAPNRLKRYARTESNRLSGMYVPYWTYDCNATSSYRGQRGDDYWTTQTYTVTVNGKPTPRTRQVRRTRWTPVSGIVSNTFDDVLVLASRVLPETHTERLEPWDLSQLKPYQEEFVAGFRVTNHQVNLGEGFQAAQTKMEPAIRSAIRRDIGGDHQQVHSVRTQHHDVTFKHILLPIWLSSYRLGDRVYRFFVNAQTAEVQGERPWSRMKIAAAVLAVAAVATGIVFLVR